MSFDYPQEPRPRKKGGISGVVMLMVIGLAVFAFMNLRGAGSNQEGESVEQGRRPVENRSQGKLDPRIDRELRQADEYRRQRENVLGDSKSESSRGSSTAKAMPTEKSTDNSDWSIDGIGDNKNASPSAVKKTQGEDGWSLEGVPTKKDSGTGFEAKNSAGGDVKLTD